MKLLGERGSWLYDTFERLDMKLARLLGFSGKRTLSDECAGSDSLGCKCLCATLSATVEEDHCNKARAARVRRELEMKGE